MPFTNRVVKEAIARAPYCEYCGHDFREQDIRHVHSATGLHLEKKSGELDFVVSDPLMPSKVLEGRILPANAFPQLSGRNDDAFVYHRGCHTQLHNCAREETRQFAGMSGHTVPPADLMEITIAFAENARQARISMAVAAMQEEEVLRTICGPDETETVLSLAPAPARLARSKIFG